MTETASETAVLDQERKERKMEGTEADSILRLNPVFLSFFLSFFLAIPLPLFPSFVCMLNLSNEFLSHVPNIRPSRQTMPSLVQRDEEMKILK